MVNLEKSTIRKWFLKISGYLVPLFQSLPPLSVWKSLMTMPLISYLIMLFTSLPESLPIALEEFFTDSAFLLDKTCIILGLTLLFYSLVYLRVKRRKGLITSGPYKLVRHPQYLGIMLFTLGLTTRSYWILTNTFGIGFLSPQQTIAAWFIEILVYILLANIEELYLSREFKEPFESYKSKTPFLIPLLKTNNKALDVLISILIPAILLWIVLQSHPRFFLY
jgi:protein-S-isoprenylcysteine O-methyltransferase Ste14